MEDGKIIPCILSKWLNKGLEVDFTLTKMVIFPHSSFNSEIFYQVKVLLAVFAAFGIYISIQFCLLKKLFHMPFKNTQDTLILKVLKTGCIAIFHLKNSYIEETEQKSSYVMSNKYLKYV